MLSIIIPTLNEEEGIAKVLCSIPKDIWAVSEVIVVDASDDFTPIIAERLGAKVIKTTRKGKGWQMRYAAQKSRGDILVFLDGDGVHPADYIPELLDKLGTSNLVLGCRSKQVVENDNPSTRKFNKFCDIFIVTLLRFINFRFPDPLTGFRAIRKEDWNKLNLESDGFEIEIEMNIKTIKLGFIVKEVKIPNLRRCGGILKSKFNINPKMWFKVLGAFFKYCKKEEINIRNIF